MITCITTEHFFRALQCCSACMVDGKPATIALPDKLPARKSKKPFAMLFWPERGAKGKPVVMRADLYAKDIQQIERTEDLSLLVTFFDYSPMEVVLLRTTEIDLVAPVMRQVATWREVPRDKLVYVEDYRISDCYSIN